MSLLVQFDMLLVKDYQTGASAALLSEAAVIISLSPFLPFPSFLPSYIFILASLFLPLPLSPLLPHTYQFTNAMKFITYQRVWLDKGTCRESFQSHWRYLVQIPILKAQQSHNTKKSNVGTNFWQPKQLTLSVLPFLFSVMQDGDIWTPSKLSPSLAALKHNSVCLFTGLKMTEWGQGHLWHLGGSSSSNIK